MHIIKAPVEASRQALLPFPDAGMHLAGPSLVRGRPRSPGLLRRAESAALLLRFEQLDLELPLYDSAQTVFDANYEVHPSTTERPATTEPPAAGDVPAHFDDLTMEHVAQMHAKLLYRQLEQLFYARNVQGDVRREVLHWVYQPSEVSHTHANGVHKLVRAVFIPFTFEACCSFEQIDAGALRQAISDRIEQLRGSRMLLAPPTEQELQ